MTTRLLLALALLAVTARLLRKRHSALLRSLPSSGQAPDDSEVVGMPTTWSAADVWDGNGMRTYLYPTTNPGNATTLGPGWYVEFAPTSRN